MRKHPHHPEFTKSCAWARFVREHKREPHSGRRAHGLTPRNAPAPSVIASAIRRAGAYANGSPAKRRIAARLAAQRAGYA